MMSEMIRAGSATRIPLARSWGVKTGRGRSAVQTYQNLDSELMIMGVDEWMKEEWRVRGRGGKEKGKDGTWELVWRSTTQRLTRFDRLQAVAATTSQEYEIR